VTLPMFALLAAEESGFHVPPLEELFEWPAFSWSQNWQLFGVDLGFNRVALFVFIAVALISMVMLMAFRRQQVVPGKLQSVGESAVGFVRDSIALEVMGPAGLKFVPLLTTMFLFIWVNNLFGIMPGMSFAATSRMAIPAFLALTVYVIFILVGVKEQGWRYFKNALIPSGVPIGILPLVIPIELISTFVVRPLTLAVRLFANMMAGHIILTIMFVAANTFLFSVTGDVGLNVKGLPIGILAFAFGTALVGFELLVGFLQAYIFTILAAVYIGSSQHAEH